LATPEEIIMGGGQSSANIQQAGEIVRLKRQLESAETRVEREMNSFIRRGHYNGIWAG
jgi:hypothetical protein